MNIAFYIDYIKEMLLNWPLLIAIIAISLLATILTKFVQIRYFFQSWMFALKETGDADAQPADMSTMQAFLNALSSSLGNGSIAGIAVAIYSGGPGAGIWILLIGLLLMAIRFCEVYLSTRGSKRAVTTMGLGGPMLYLQELPYGRWLAYVYGVSTVFFGFAGGNAAQTNSIRLSLQQTIGCASPSFKVLIAVSLMCFVLYVVYGGAKRIVRISDFIVPLKVIVFFCSAIIILCYHYKSLIDALYLMIESAFGYQAYTGALIGFTIQQAMRAGINGVVFATEAGLGTAPILYGGAASKAPIKDGIASMLSTFISTIVCFLIAWMIVASGMWQSGLTSTALTVQTFSTVFGAWGGWLVTFLSISFGMGVLVTYAYITQAAWLYITGARGQQWFVFCYALAAFIGAMVQVQLLWSILAIVNAIMLIINLLAIIYLFPNIQRALSKYRTNP